MKPLATQVFTDWLRQYGEAWQRRDSKGAAQLFSEDAKYYWTPHDAPQSGRAEIAAAWEGAVSHQKDVRFTFEPFAVAGAAGMARWHASFVSLADGKPKELDGVLRAEFDDEGLCREFREWWHFRND